MKIVLAVFVFILFSKITLAQQDLLSFDEHNKYIYYQVLEMPGMPADTLHARAVSFLKMQYPKFKEKSAINKDNIIGEGKFITYSGISVMKHESGEIAYALNMEFKDQKYRYWLTDFTFIPYARDRYGNFVPQQGRGIHLETAASKLDKKEVDHYLNDTGAFCSQFGGDLKLYTTKASTPKKTEPAKKVVTANW